MASKRQQTMAKMARERAVKERRALKLEKKRAAAAQRKARALGLEIPADEENEPAFSPAATVQGTDDAVVP